MAKCVAFFSDRLCYCIEKFTLILDVRTFRGSEINCDHYLLVATRKLKFQGLVDRKINNYCDITKIYD